MPRTYQTKMLPDGGPNPRYKTDTRKGDRHLNKDDRHLNNGDRHAHRRKDGFIAIDGEGITTDEIIGYANSEYGEQLPVYRQLYVLLMASDGTFVYNENGLLPEECYDYLIDLAKRHPDKSLVWYGSTYDTTEMFKDMSIEVLSKLYQDRSTEATTDTVKYDGINGRRYAILYRRGKWLTVSRFVYGQENYTYKKGKREPNYEDNISATLWDVHGFFQCRFVDALGSKERGYFTQYIHEELIDGKYHEIIEWPDGLRIDLTDMKSMKSKRGSFSFEQLEQIKSYCQDEITALERLMDLLKEYLEEADLLPYQSKWHGAGSCASALLHKYNVKEAMDEKIYDMPLKEAQLHAYSGGRFEMGKYGVYIGKVWNYDLRSAFPSVMMELPTLTDGLWRHVKGASSKPYSIMHVRWSFKDNSSRVPFFPFFFRSWFNGSIYYPPEGEGWYWKPEVDAAIRAWNEGKLSTSKWMDKDFIEVIESWEFQPFYDVKPFAFIQELYDKRSRWKQEGNPAEKILKYIINSFYGKLIQAMGWHVDKKSNDLRKPSYHNVGYAGYTTSAVRAKVFDAIMQAPHDIVNITSDGVYSLVPLDLPVGDGIGQWKLTELDGIVVAGSGVYWGLKRLGREPTEQEKQEEYFDDKYWKHNGEWFRVNSHYQSYNRGEITVEKVVEAWRDIRTGKNLLAYSTRLVTIASALMNPEELLQYLGSWRTIGCKVTIYPYGKRWSENSVINARPDKRLENTNALLLNSDDMSDISCKYDLPWEDKDYEYGKTDGVDNAIYDDEFRESWL